MALLHEHPPPPTAAHRTGVAVGDVGQKSPTEAPFAKLQRVCECPAADSEAAQPSSGWQSELRLALQDTGDDCLWTACELSVLNLQARTPESK